jgi:hypothetical protein
MKKDKVKRRRVIDYFGGENENGEDREVWNPTSSVSIRE